jgi:hypothetical protein
MTKADTRGITQPYILGLQMISPGIVRHPFRDVQCVVLVILGADPSGSAARVVALPSPTG